MAYISGFNDNQLIGVDDLNEITKRLVYSGIENVLTDDGSLCVTDLNGITTALVTDGVVPETVNTLKVTKSGTTYTIAPGLCFFSDGSFIEITSNEKLSFNGSDGYVYLFNDIALGEKKPMVTSAYPTGDFVMLAQITNGTVIDKRKYAKGKVASYSSYAGYPLCVKQSVVCTGENKWDRRGSFTVDLGNYPLRGIVVQGTASGTPGASGVCFFDENKKVSFYRCSANYEVSHTYKNYLLQYYYNESFYVRLTFSCTQDGILTVNVVSSSSLNSATETCTENIEFYVF